MRALNYDANIGSPVVSSRVNFLSVVGGPAGLVASCGGIFIAPVSRNMSLVFYAV